MLNVEDLKKVLIESVQSGSFPGSAPTLSNAIRSYVTSNGTPNPPTISFSLGPCSGAGWIALSAKACDTGVAEYIISTAIITEFASSTKVIPGPTGVETVPMTFNTSAKVKNLSDVTDYNIVWEEIAKAVIDFFKTEIQ